MVLGITLSISLCLLQQSSNDLLASKNADAARAITSEFGLDLWSQKLLDRSLNSTSNPDGKSTLLLAKCDVLRMVAFRKIDENERLSALGEAGDAYIAYLEAGARASETTKAQSNLGQLSFLYGKTLLELIRSEKISGEQKDGAVEKAENIFKAALKGMNAVISWWEALEDDNPEKASTEYTDYFPSVYNRGVVYRFWAELYPKDSLDREQKAGKALDLLDDFALGAPFLPQQRAHCAIADCYAVLGELQDANDYYLYVIDSVDELIEQSESNLNTAFVNQLNDCSQEAYLGMLNVAANNGNTADFWSTYNNFESWVTGNNVTLQAYGYQCRLKAAEQMTNEGRASEAINLAASVAQDNERSVLRLMANSIMGKAIKIAPASAEISFDIIYSSAEGAYFQKRYADAVEGFRLLIPRLKNTDIEYGAKAYYYLGLSWSKLDESLLAMVSHEEGYKQFPNDEEFSLKNAQKWQSAAEKLSLANPNDETLIKLNSDATAAVQELGGGSDNLAWTQAKQRLDLAIKAKNNARKAETNSTETRQAIEAYTRAIEALADIPTDNDFFETAMVERGKAEYELSAFDPLATNRAITILESYLNEYIKDPSNDPQDPRQRKVRRDKEPVAIFYLGLAHRNSGNFLAVLSTFENFLSKFPTQKDLAYATMTYRIESYIALKQIDAAKKEYEQMFEVGAIDSRKSIGAYYLYRHFGAEAEMLKGESRIETLKEVAKYFNDFNSYATSPRWQNLLAEAEVLSELGDHKNAAELYERILQTATKENDYTAAFDFKIKIGYVESLLQLRQIGKAVPMVDDLLTTRGKNLRVKSAAVKVKAGFLLYEKNRVIEVPGEGTEEALKTASTLAEEIIKLAAYDAEQQDPPVNKYYHPAWWEAQLTYSYVLYQRNMSNPADVGKHREKVSALRRQAPGLGEDIVGRRVSEPLKWLENR